LLPYRSHDGNDVGIVYFLSKYGQHFALCISDFTRQEDIGRRNFYTLSKQVSTIAEADSNLLLIICVKGLYKLLFSTFSHLLTMLSGCAKREAIGRCIWMQGYDYGSAVIVDHFAA